MDYKEKLRLAKEAIDSGSYDKETIEYIFPELKENEGERIRKELIRAFQSLNTIDVWNGIKRSDILAYLEKQGERKHQYKSRPRYVGEVELLGKKESTVFIGDENIRKALIEMVNDTVGDSLWIDYNVHKEDAVDWLEKQGEQKPAEWSEEDEQYLLVCKNALAKYQVSDKWDATIISQWLEYKLKSLRPQSQWKPSNEQLYTLEKATHIVGSKYKSCLASLYQDLKKLREE